MKVEYKTIAVTGAASGIGRATAVELAKRGANVAISDVNREGLDETAEMAEAHNVKVHVADLDVANRDAVYDWADTVKSVFGDVHGIVNNAGVALRCTVDDMDYDDFEWLMNINFWGVVYGTKAFLPHLRSAGEGHIVNISSVFGIMGIPTQSAYNASKFAVRGFTESLRSEMLVERAPIGVTCVHPGGIKTSIVRNGRMREMTQYSEKVNVVQDFEGRLARTSAEDAGVAIADGIEKNKARVLIGADAHLIDRAQRNLPTRYQQIVAAIFRSTVDEKH